MNEKSAIFPSHQQNGAVHGSWYSGEKPERIKEGSYPILFIHGINTTSETWSIDGNDIGETARSRGFETAFINLSGTEDMWTNGLLLAGKLGEISEHFKKKVVILAHSKGGIDAQTAMVYHGAARYVKRVITLSTPHHGSELADLAYSKWADWLAETLGSRCDAVFSLQTGYMKAYRNRTDADAERLEPRFYTFGGTGWGSMGSALFWGGLYLSRFGTSDGAVTVISSRLPYGQEVMVDDWTHKTIKQGEEIFPYVERLVLEQVDEIPVPTVQVSAEEEVQTSVLHRGGRYTGIQRERFLVEDGVDGITVDWISCFRDTALVLTDPEGRTYTNFVTTGDETGFFPNAFHHSIMIDQPAYGKWELESRNDSEETYLLNVMYTNGVNPQINEVVNGVEVDFEGQGMNMYHTSTINKQVHLIHFPVSKKEGKKSIENPSDISPGCLAQYGEGIHNITIDIKGTTLIGNEYERTIVKTIFVDRDGNIHT
ncbi:esterase/lipase family protein [Rossellomorea sp. NS-SX7]|uniref:esterase/lipase family protein n=1 Tax=Rossellomorea sp. NS-SX7 TaxID=3463856 RepID=UPI0040599A4B